jgi:hypothetical protein
MTHKGQSPARREPAGTRMSPSFINVVSNNQKSYKQSLQQFSRRILKRQTCEWGWMDAGQSCMILLALQSKLEWRMFCGCRGSEDC